MRRRDFLRTSTVAVGVSLLEGCRSTEEQFLVQVPRRPGVLQGETVWRASVCAQCSAGCAVQVRVVDGNAKKVEGTPDYPVNHGGVCALGQSLLQELYNPDRFLSPQRLTGARGEGGFEAVSWEDALAQVVDALGGTSGENIAFVGSDRWGLTGGLLRRLAAALGAPAPTFIEAAGLDVERAAARIALGVDDVPYFDIGRSEYVLSVGAPMLDRWRSPVHYIGQLTEMRSGRPGRRGKLVHAEARMSLTAAKADEWLPVRPGTEGMLARGVAGLLLAEGGVSAGARERYATLFPDAPPGLDQVAEACDVDAAQIERVARELQAAEARVVVAGGSAAAHTNGLFNVVAALGLNLLLDNLGQPGGVFAPTRFDLAGGVLPEDGGPTPPADLAAGSEARRAHRWRCCCRGRRSPPRPSGEWGLVDALADVGTVVSLSSFADDTTLHADLVLPLLTEVERFTLPSRRRRWVWASWVSPRRSVDPVGEANHPADVILGVAAALGGPVAEQFPWSSLEALVRERIEQEQARLPGGADVDASTYYFDAPDRGGIFEEGPPSRRSPGSFRPGAGRGRGPAGRRREQLPVPASSVRIRQDGGGPRGEPAVAPGAARPDVDRHVELLGGALTLRRGALGIADGDRLRIESAARLDRGARRHRSRRSAGRRRYPDGAGPPRLRTLRGQGRGANPGSRGHVSGRRHFGSRMGLDPGADRADSARRPLARFGRSYDGSRSQRE